MFVPVVIFSLVLNLSNAFHMPRVSVNSVQHRVEILRGKSPQNLACTPKRSLGNFVLLMASKDDEKTNNNSISKGLPFSIPSLTQILYVWLSVTSGVRLVNSLLAANSAVISAKLAIDGVVCVGALFLLFQTLKKVDYDSLEDIDQKSLACQAGKWALEEEIPVTFEYNDKNYEVATFAGGCFWGTELHYQRIPGVVATCVGYTQGSIDMPKYEQVCSGTTGHTEGIQMIYDPAVCSYSRLVTRLLDIINPTLLNRVGNDSGTQYRHGIYTHSKEQAETATETIDQRQKSLSDPIVTELFPATVFWPAENYHQRYLEKGGQSADKDSEETVRCYG